MAGQSIMVPVIFIGVLYIVPMHTQTTNCNDPAQRNTFACAFSTDFFSRFPSSPFFNRNRANTGAQNNNQVNNNQANNNQVNNNQVNNNQVNNNQAVPQQRNDFFDNFFNSRFQPVGFGTNTGNVGGNSFPTNTNTNTNPNTNTANTAVAGKNRDPSRLPTGEEIAAIRAGLRQLLNDSKVDLAPKWVELGFHQCVGGCDGCIDTKVKANEILIEPYNQLREFHRTQAQAISLADLLALAAVEGANEGFRRAGRERRIPIKFGRSTCPDPDNVSKTGEFPNGDDPNALEVLMRELKLTRPEAIALLGAHSIGKCSKTNLGFEGPWDNTPDLLDNGYYKSMHGREWTPVTSPGGSTQWVPDFDKGKDLNSSTPTGMMLHADMGIIANFTVSGVKKLPSCTKVSECPIAAGREQTERYAHDQDLFENEFIPVFVKMLENTNSALTTIQEPAPPATPAPAPVPAPAPAAPAPAPAAPAPAPTTA